MSDFERPLTDSGIHDAGFMAKQLKKAELIPEYILTSSALRTKMTADVIAKTLAITPTGFDKNIYEAGIGTLLKIVNQLPDNYSFVALVGHNPGISQLLYELTGEMRDMPTAAAALIGFDFDEWEMVYGNTGQLAWYDSPKEH